MIRSFSLKRIRENKIFQIIYNYNLLAFVFLMSFWNVILPKLIFVWILLWFIEGDFKNKFRKLRSQKIFFLFTGFYVFHAISLLYSSNIDAGIFDLEVKASILVMPFLLLSEKLYDFRLRNKIKIVFVSGVLLALIICLIRAWYRTYVTDESTVIELYGWGTAARHMFFYTELSYFKHPSYFSMYIVFAAAILLQLFEKAGKFPHKRAIFIFFTGLILFIFFLSVFLLSSKAGMLAGILILLTYGLYQLLVLKIKKIFWLFIFLFVATTFFFYKVNPRVIYTVKSFENSVIEDFNDNDTITSEINVAPKIIIDKKNDRLSIWYYSLETIKNNYIIGIGVGDNRDELIKIYEKHDLTEAAKAKLNIHNQYLETLIGLGIIGLIWLLTILTCPFILFFKHKKFIYPAFIIIVGTHFLFESMLNTQAGVIFFAFFYSFFFIIQNDETFTFQD